MKKLLLSLSLAGALAAFADDGVDASAQVFGVLTVTSGETNVIVAVPWVAATNESVSTIPVADIVKTANLTAGDWVRVWNTSQKSFNVWNLDEDTETGIKSWVKGTTVKPSGIEEGTGADVAALQRGDALVLHRQNPKDAGGNPNSFYLYGQYLSSVSTYTDCALGTDTTPAYTLIAPPSVTNTYVKLLKFSNVFVKDYLVVEKNSKAQMVGRNLDNTQWGENVSTVTRVGGKLQKTSQWNETTAVIPAGTGIWYVSNGGEQAPRVAW